MNCKTTHKRTYRLVHVVLQSSQLINTLLTCQLYTNSKNEKYNRPKQNAGELKRHDVVLNYQLYILYTV